MKFDSIQIQFHCGHIMFSPVKWSIIIPSAESQSIIPEFMT